MIDGASPDADMRIRVVDEVLSEIGAGGKPTINVYNKCDISGEVIPSNTANNVFISAKTGRGIDDLMQAIADTAPGKKLRTTLLIPYSDGGVLNALHTTEKIISEEYRDDGIKLRALIDGALLTKVKKYEINEG